MPLELKTGRASFSAEHTGQLIIYQMMMSEVCEEKIDSGLLLYLREGVMREIKGSYNEKRDLILLRNDLAYYLTKQNELYAHLKGQPLASVQHENNRLEQSFLEHFKQLSTHPELPEPINHHSACGSCPYNILCSLYLKQNKDQLALLSESHPMRTISGLVTIHLTEAHIEYFCHWIALLALEEQESSNG